MLIVVTPGGFEGFFRDLAAAEQEGRLPDAGRLGEVRDHLALARLVER